ncbi:MAG TPA: UbiD family decarboxylase, partial [Terriglobales bacterium]|nr:UbiD family decarboxylase [Terriglobales bacterium]
MAHLYFSDFRSYLEELERRGKLHRWTRPVNKDTQLMPLMRLQYRGIPDEQRQAFLFERVVDSRGCTHDIRVATGMYGSSREIAALGLGCDQPMEIFEKWRHALAKPFEPRRVASSPVQEIIFTGEALKKFGVTGLPAPVEEPGFSGGIRATAPFITQDGETGVRNVGMYSGHFRGEDRLIAGIAPTHHAILYHHRGAIERKEPLPVAIVLGALPDINFVSAANLPYGVDELAVAGGIRGRPVDVIPCKTIPLEVPADAEIIIEGEISMDRKERGEPFSDYPGYLMVEREFRAVIDVKAITMRRDAIFTAILV